MHTFFIRLVLIALLGGIPAGALAEAMNQPAPDFTLKSGEGENIRLQDFRGQVVMLNFWASWCGPCRQEMPLMDDLHARYKDLGFSVLAVNLDKNITEAERFLSAVPVSFPILYDPESQVASLYGVEAMPSTVMIDRDGNARFLHRGYKPGFEEDYERQIRQLVRE
jgi:peroxiredoxin